ncbi:histidinol-phosphate transaminase [Stetteria hydrogenophila]
MSGGGAFKPWILGVPVYEPGSYEGVGVRLDLNECPHPPPGFVVEAAAAELGRVNRYPEAGLVGRAYRALASYTGFSVDRLAIGAGGDDLLKAVFAGTLEPGDTVAAPRYSFSSYKSLARLHGARVSWVPMEPRGEWWVIDEDALFEEAGRAKLVVLDRPNNPTGSMLLPKARVEELLEEARGLVLVDEAYYEFAGETVAELTESHENLVVVRTLSKAFCLAGLRLGYAIAHKSTAAAIRRVLSPFPVSRPSLAAAAAALENPGYALEEAERVRGERERLRSMLQAAGARVYASRTNFLLADTGIPRVVEKLRRRGIAVKRVPLGDSWLRATVGLPSENEALAKALAELSRRGRG